MPMRPMRASMRARGSGRAGRSSAVVGGLFLLVLVAAPPFASASDIDWAEAGLRQGDLPSGFVPMETVPPLLEDWRDLALEIAESGERSRLRNESAFVSGRWDVLEGAPVEGGAEERAALVEQLEWVSSVVAYPLSAAERREIEQATPADREALAAELGGTLIPGSEGIGDASMGVEMVQPLGELEGVGEISIRGQIVMAVRGDAFLVVLVSGGGALQTDAVELAEILDGRVARALGLGDYRPTGPLVPRITTEIPTPLDVSTDPKVVFANLVLAALAMALFTIAVKVLNTSLVEHETTLQRLFPPARWLAALQRRADAALSSGLRRRSLIDAVRLVSILLFYGLAFSFLDPTWNPLSITGLALFVYMTLAFGLIGIADDLVEWRVARRWGVAAELAMRPALVLLAVGSTVATRVFGIVPGIMLGTPEAFPVETAELDERRESRLLRVGSVTLVVVGLGAWLLSIATTSLREAGMPNAVGIAVAGVEAFLVLVFAVAVQNFFIQMLPFRGSQGEALRRVNRWGWRSALVLASFLFFHTLINPEGELAESLRSTNVVFFFATVGAFLSFTGLVWIAFRRRDRRAMTAARVEPAVPWPREPAIDEPAEPAVPGPVATLRSMLPTGPPEVPQSLPPPPAEAPRFSHSGMRYVLGYWEDAFWIWDRTHPEAPIHRFPRTQAGWEEAWRRFTEIESAWVEVIDSLVR